jgi:hypothetical protein
MGLMGWVHGHKRHGALLALAALALQIVLSFGHVHLDGIRAANARQTVAVTHQAAVAQASRQGPAQNPGADDDYCAICASIYLASTSMIAHAPALPVQLGFHRIEHSYTATRDIAAPRRFAFQSRAPPAA